MKNNQEKTKQNLGFYLRKIISILCMMMLLSILPMFPKTVLGAGIDNISARADYLYNIQWTAQKDIKSWRNKDTFKQGRLYRIPYAQPVSQGKYIYWGASIEQFLNAANNASSEFYSSRSYYAGNEGSYSTFYGMDCSAFVSYCWDLPARKTTEWFSQRPLNYGICNSTNVYKIQKGDVLNRYKVPKKGNHVILISNVSYDSNGNIVQFEITEETPIELIRRCFPPKDLASKYSDYTIYRYENRDNVSPPPVTGNSPISNLDSWSGGIGTINIRGWAFDKDDTSQSIPVHIYIGGPAGSADAEGYPITANVFRDDVNADYGCGNYHGFDASIPTSKIGEQPIYIYAINIGTGSTQLIAQKTVTITSPDTEPPVISNVRIENLTNQGYDVVCNVTDNLNVNRVQFVTWSDAGGQDDIAPGWENNSIVSGTKNNNGEYVFHVNIADHLGNRGVYSTHIYAYDDYGNNSGYPLTVTIPGYDYCFDEISLSDDNLYIKGWATAVNGFGDIEISLTDENKKSVTYPILNRYSRDDIDNLRPEWDTSLAGFDETFSVSNLKPGNIKVKVIGKTNETEYILYDKLIAYNDTIAPVITNAQIVDVTNQGYKVVCHTTDNISVNRVQFATWSEANSQDDLVSNWTTNPVISGTMTSDGNYEFNVNIDDHIGNRGLYHTHIYAFDNSGNASFVPLDIVIPGYDANFDLATLDCRDLTISGWATSVNGIEELKMTVTDRKGKVAVYNITNRFNRADITSLRPDWNTENAGYNQTFDLSDLAAGSAIVEITGELYQEDVSKSVYSLGKKTIELKDNLSADININENEYLPREPVEISVSVDGAESLYINIYNESGLYDTIKTDSNNTYIRAFEIPGEYYMNAKAIGYKETLSSNNVYFTILEEPEPESDAVESNDILISDFSYESYETHTSVSLSFDNIPESASAYIASYDNTGSLLEIKKAELLYGSSKTDFKEKGISEFRAFVWESNTLTPLTSTIILKL